MVLPISCSKCKNKTENIFKGERSNEILKIIGLINNIEEYQKNMNQEFRLKKIDQAISYLIEEISQNE